MKSKTDIRTLSEKELNARLVRDLTEACPAGEREALAALRAAGPGGMKRNTLGSGAIGTPA